MVSNLNFLAHESRYRVVSIVGELRTRLLILGLGLGTGFAIVAIMWFVGDLRVHDEEAQIALLQVQEHSLDMRRAKLSASLTGQVADLQDIMPRIEAIRDSGGLFADRLAAIGNVKPDRAWVDAIANDGTTITVDGGSRSLRDVAALMRSFSNAGYTPRATQILPAQARGAFFTYDIVAARADVAVAQTTAAPGAPSAGAR